MSKVQFQDYLCRPFCSFFRAGVKEEMACQGALLLEDLVKRNILAPERLPGREGKKEHLWQEQDSELERILCPPCPFAMDGCDFHSDLRTPESEPCGGYLLLKLLKERGILSAAEMDGVLKGGANVA